MYFQFTPQLWSNATRLKSLIAAFSLAASFAFATSTRAQTPCDCPPAPVDDAQSNPTTVLWQKGQMANVDLNGDGCLYTICYIYRQTSPNNYDYGITKVCWTPPCPEPDLAVALWYVMNANPADFPCPTCPSTLNNWAENFVTCWKVGIAPDGTKYKEICPDHGWCLHGYKVCCDPITGAKTFTHARDVTTTYQCRGDGCNQEPCPSIE